MRINYRRIYKQHCGKIPKDSEGRTFDIHHIDGNHANNDPTNLKAITIQEHYDIHYSQGDWGACQAIALRMQTSPTLISDLTQRRIKDGTHNFIKDNPMHKLVKQGIHPWLGDGTYQRNNAMRRVEAGTHNFQSDKNKASRKIYQNTVSICPYCNKSGKGSVMRRWHFDNCKDKQ